jgi:hypothetical protein
MGINYLLVLSTIYLFFSCGKCEEDQYGENLVLIVPITTTPFDDSLSLGDTLWIDVHIDKEVSIVNSIKTIRLDSFNFFTELFISEISGVEEDYYTPIDTVVLKGKLHYLPLPTALVYPVVYEENLDNYTFKVGIVPREKGLFWIGFSSHIKVLELYDHPALYLCEGNRRDEVRIQYKNSSTNHENFESIFKKTEVSYLQNVKYDDFAGVGSVALIVF